MAALKPGMIPAYDGSVKDWFQLLKPRVMYLVIFTAFTGMVMAPGDLHPVLAAIAILAISVGAGASGAINMWYDRDIDAVMRRTKGRPLPAGKISHEDALIFGVVLSLLSVMVMGLAINWTAALLLAGTIGFYVFIYTMWLKRRTPQNIVIGGAAGAFPPMIGWAAVTGDVSLVSVVLFLIIFMWTPPHFWALSLYTNTDYTTAKIPMLPVVAGETETKRQMMIYSVLLAPLGAAPWLLGATTAFYGVAASVLGALFLLSTVHVWRSANGSTEQTRRAKQLFAYSILYLFLIFTFLLLDVWVGEGVIAAITGVL
ncbi:MAG: heme o synthase [Alphaproteobacteria bacterium]|nr:heme o synthase [Alphaproteobacteria bacterium]